MLRIGKLSQLAPGARALVLDIESADGIRRRLQDLGLVSGTEVTCIQKSPLGDPVAFLIRGALIALRSEDSSCVSVQTCEEWGYEAQRGYRAVKQIKA